MIQVSTLTVSGSCPPALLLVEMWGGEVLSLKLSPEGEGPPVLLLLKNNATRHPVLLLLTAASHGQNGPHALLAVMEES